MITELHQPLEVVVVSKDNAKATVFALIDYGPESDLYFMCIFGDGQVWCAPNKDVRVTNNWTIGRRG